MTRAPERTHHVCLVDVKKQSSATPSSQTYGN